MKKGVVVSDMHFFAKRSNAAAVEKELYSLLPECDILILNGDMFDFRWTVLSSVDETIAAAAVWIEKVMDDFPNISIKYILGNHDCNPAFIDRLRALEKERSRFFLYEYYLQLGELMFLHGDCANKITTFEKHKKFRARWLRTKQWPSFLILGYRMLDIIGLAKIAHLIKFPKVKTAKKIVYYINTIPSVVSSDIKSIYFGHTHILLSDFTWDKFVFYNSGSAIKGLEFYIHSFTLDEPFREQGL